MAFGRFSIVFLIIQLGYSPAFDPVRVTVGSVCSTRYAVTHVADCYDACSLLRRKARTRDSLAVFALGRSPINFIVGTVAYLISNGQTRSANNYHSGIGRFNAYLTKYCDM
jgi:hypothetical protein